MVRAITAEGSMRRLAFLIGSLCFVACGPSAKGPGNGDDDTKVDANPALPDAYTGPTGTVTGRVWMPSYGPGQVPAGQEIPVFGALVSLTTEKLAPIPDHVYCEQCQDATTGAVSGHDGSFSITVPPGMYWLTIQKGQFRLEEPVIVSEAPLDLPSAATTLPSQYDPAHGAWIPKVAVAVGNYDAVEDILGKIGFGQMNAAKDDLTSGTGEHGVEIKLYEYGGTPSVASLLQSLDEMRKYHIIFFPCSTDVDDNLLKNAAVQKNIRQYVNEGGKIYVTDWSGETGDIAFPPQIQLGNEGFLGTEDLDTVGTYDPKTFTGAITTYGSSDGNEYNSDDGKANDPDLAAWLGGQSSPDAAGNVSMINPAKFDVLDNYNYVEALKPVQIGVDSQGLPVVDQPKAWVLASDPNLDDNKKLRPMSVTYQPTGCGRVLYSTYQTSGTSADEKHAGLTTQERVLLYLIMEIQVCNSIIVN
jgi:hypothetical protein